MGFNAGYPWPFTPIRTYQQNQVPVIDAGDLNDLQRAITILFGSACTRGAYSFLENFDAFQNIGASVGTSTTGPLTGTKFSITSVTNAMKAVQNDSSIYGAGPANSDGAFGVLSIESNSNATANAITLKSGFLFPGTGRDFWFGARVKVRKTRLVTIGTGNGFAIGMNDASAGWLQFVAASDLTNWRIVTDTGTNRDSGVALTDDTWYSLQAIRVGASIIYYINGSPVYTDTTNTNYGIWTPRIDVSGITGINANLEYAAVDAYSFLSLA